MRLLRLSSLLVLVAFLPLTDHPKAAGEATFHTGITGGIVRDATKVGSVIYAVGTWANASLGGRIDGALWTLDGVNPPQRTVLPDVNVNNSSTALNLTAGEAITPDAAYIASQARSATGPTAVRLTASLLANLNLTPFPLTNSNGAALASTISDDGAVLYGSVVVSLSVPADGLNLRRRAMRFEVTGSTSTATMIYPQPATNASGNINQSMLARGASSDGRIAVGQTFTTLAANNDSQAFRYVNGPGGGVFSIPRLPGGTFNAPIALSDLGNIIALVGNSTEFGREPYIRNLATPTPQTIRIGVPNTDPSWSFVGPGGITNDGSVVVGTSTDSCAPTPCTPRRYAYFHNSHGWFHLTAALRDAGVDLSGWEKLQALGMSGDGTLVWGSGAHNDAQEGFVAEFDSDYLKNYNPRPTAPADSSIVGVWGMGDFPLDPANPQGIIAFLADGTYFDIEPDGFERGFYTVDGNTVKVWTLVDTNGRSGLSDENGGSFTVSLAGDELRSPANCVPVPDGDCGFLTRITSTADSLVGGWIGGDPTQNNSSLIFVMTAGGRFFFAEDGDTLVQPGGRDGIEIGQASWDPVTHVLTPTSFDVDTNGEWGLSHAFGSITATLAVGGLSMEFGDDGGTGVGTRIVDPDSVAVFTGGSIQGTLGTPFTYQVAASGAQGYGATGLPPGLTIHPITGEISGTPTEVGIFQVGVFATNPYVGATLNLTIVSTVQITSTGSVEVEPTVPEDTPPLTMAFDNVTGTGSTTVAIVDPETATDPDVPSNFQIAYAGGVPLYYEITTTASFTGPVTICFSYAGVDFGALTPRLLHLDKTVLPGQWVDITTSVDSVTQTLCGTTTSFSPFVIVTSAAPFVTSTGFYAPVSPLAGFVNTAKGGSTVPLKFNVYVNGVEKTDTTGITFAVTSSVCSLSAEDPVDFDTTGDTSLRYEGNQFIQNWKTPKTAGLCYTVRVSLDDDGPAGEPATVLLTTKFKLK